MTEVYINWDGLILKAEGHAGQAAYGQDIVCAAVSVLTQALALRLAEDEKRGRLRADIKIDKDKGSLRLQAWPNSGRETQTRAYFKVIATGLKTIAEQYPQNVKYGEVDEDGIL